MRCKRVIQNCTLSCERISNRILSNFLQRIAPRSSIRYPERSAAKSKDPAAKRQGNAAGFLDFARNDQQLLRLRDDSKIWLRCLPAVWISLLRLIIRDRAGDYDVVSWQPVNRRSHLVLRREL